MPSRTVSKPTAKRLVLSLLAAPSLPEVSITMLLRWGELFDIDAATMRVTVGRLTRQGLLSSVSRGIYRMGPAGRTLATAAGGWRDVESRLEAWEGDWLLVHVAHLGRVNRTGLRARERAFRLGGFAELASGLWIRPANFREAALETRQRLVALGLEPAAVMARARELPGAKERELYSLWPRRELQGDYQRQLRAMRASSARLERLSLEDAARETLLVGEAVIRQINADPLLPSAMIDTTLRGEMISRMLEYDALGRGIWGRFVASSAT